MTHDDPTVELLAPGARVGRVVVRSLLGTGGMGEVYLAHDESLDRLVAMKLLGGRLSTDVEHRERFLREARAAAALSHPNVVHIYEVGEHDDRPYFLMEYIEGESLRERLASSPPSLDEAVRIATEIARGLDAAHSAGIVHRDLKPANIMLDRSDRVRIVDFGLAHVRSAEPLTKSGTTLGTLAYMSPEQSRGEPADARSDLFSLGSILYEMIAARPPFARRTDAATLAAIVSEAPEPMARYANSVPGPIQAIVAKLLDKSPATRCQSAAEFLADVSRHDATPTDRPGWRGPVVAAIGLAIVFVAGVSWWGRSSAPPTDPAANTDRIAILRFENLAEPADDSRWGDIIASLLVTDLTEARDFHVVSRQRVSEAARDGGSAFEVARRVGATRIVTGQILGVDPIVVTCDLVDVATGDLIRSNRFTGSTEDGVFTLVDDLTSDLRRSSDVTLEDDPPIADVTTHSAAAYRAFVEAMELRSKLLREQARAKLLEAVELDPAFCEAHVELATTFGRLDSEWMTHIQNAIAHRDRASWKTKALIDVLEAEWIDKDSERALAINIAAVERDPFDIRLLEDLAFGYNENNRSAESIETWRRVLELDPRHRIAYNSIAYVAGKLGDFDTSFWAIDQYIDIAPDEANPYDTKAEILVATGHVDAGIAAYRKAYSIDPSLNPRTPYLIAMYREMNGDTTGVFAEFDPLLSADDYRAQGRGLLGAATIHTLRGRTAEALAWVSRANAVVDTTGNADAASQVHTSRADVLATRGDVAGELASLELASTATRGSWLWSAALERYASRLADLERWSEVDAIVDSLSAYAPSDMFRDWTVARVRALRGDFLAALPELESAYGEFGDFYGLYEIGRLALVNGETAIAIDYLERAEGRFDQSRAHYAALHALVSYRLGLAYEAVGQGDSAADAYDTFLERWANADVERMELDDARTRLATLRRTGSTHP